ncbi:MAG: hypothetical protein KDD03_08830, partial [Gelidibacter sp.]|nr:hypothetical protein [Gelidibacter sp.]
MEIWLIRKKPEGKRRCPPVKFEFKEYNKTYRSKLYEGRKKLAAPIRAEQGGPKIIIDLSIEIVHKNIDQKKCRHEHIYTGIELKEIIGQCPELFKYCQTDHQWKKGL